MGLLQAVILDLRACEIGYRAAKAEGQEQALGPQGVLFEWWFTVLARRLVDVL